MKILGVFHSSLTYGQIRASPSQERKSVKDVHRPLPCCSISSLVKVRIANHGHFSNMGLNYRLLNQLSHKD